MSGNASDSQAPEFDWVQLKAELDAPHAGTAESFEQKLRRKIKENPVVPLGCLLTAGALTYGLASFRRGDKRTSQIMMRVRIGAQGFTIVSMLGGILYTASKTPTPNSAT